MILLRRVRLEFKAGSSDKFYLAEAYENPDGTAQLSFRWGRRGSVGQEKVEECDTVGYALWALVQKVEEKRNGGYVVVEDRRGYGALRRPVARAASDPRNDRRDVTADAVFPMDGERRVRLK